MPRNPAGEPSALQNVHQPRRLSICALLVSAAMFGCHDRQDASRGVVVAHDLGDEITSATLKAQTADRALLDDIRLDSIRYQQIAEVDAVPSLVPTCGVKYVAGEGWGIVPSSTYPCDDKKAEGKAIQEARPRLRTAIGLAPTDPMARLAALDAGIGWATNKAADVVYTSALGVSFDLESCVDSLADRLAASVSQAAALRCDQFLAPGSELDGLRQRVREAADRAKGMMAAAAAPTPLTPETAGRCDARPARSNLGVPGTVQGNYQGRGEAYKVRLGAGQAVELRLTSDFDSYLELYDASCSTQLTFDDDSGGDFDAQIAWTVPSDGDYVVVVSSSPEAADTGRYRLSISATPSQEVVSEERRAAARVAHGRLQALSDKNLLAIWQGGAAEDLQLSCLQRERFRDKAERRSVALHASLQSCFQSLEKAAEARKMVLASQRPQ